MQSSDTRQNPLLIFPVLSPLVSYSSVSFFFLQKLRSKVEGRDDILVKVDALLKIVPGWKGLLGANVLPEDHTVIRQHERTGRPLRKGNLIDKLEIELGRMLRPQKPGSKKKANG